MLHIWDGQTEELTVIKDASAESFKAQIIASANESINDFDFDVWLEENQYTLIDADDIQKESIKAFIQW